MNEKYLDPIRNKLIKETADTIRAYLKLRKRNGHTSPNFPMYICDFFGTYRYEDGLSNYPTAAAKVLAVLAEKKSAQPFVESVGDYHFGYLVEMLQNMIELCHWLNDNPSHAAEMELHLYAEADPGGNTEQIQRDLNKYTALLKYEQEIEAGEKGLSGKPAK